MKLIGMIIISICCSLFGIGYAINEKYRFTVICEIERLIRYMAHQIEHYRQNLTDIFISFDSDILDDCGFSRGLSESWEEAVKVIDCPHIIKRELISLGQGLGMKDTREQVECCQRCLNVIEEYTKEEKKALSARMKIHVCLGITVGVVILIMGI